MTRITRATTRRLSQMGEEVKDTPSKSSITRRRAPTLIVISSESSSSSKSDSDDEKEVRGKQKKYVKRTNKSKIVKEPNENKVCKSEFKSPRKEKSRTSIKELEADSPVTPPKQLKTTPRKEQIENVPQTPSSMLMRLVLTSPDKNGVSSKKCSSSRKSLFKEVKNEEKDVLASARRALHSSFPTDMPGREKELQELKSFIKSHLDNKSSGSLYVSGPPGTGKTASLNIILQEEGIKSQFQEIYVNCTAIKSSASIYARIVKELGIKSASKNEKDSLHLIESYLRKKHKTILLVLDEIDQLESKNQSILYTIFEWPAKPHSNLILIGIANALDLTDRILPRLQARCELKPQLMHFPPYTRQQIVDIFTQRLRNAGVLDVFAPAALQLLAGKVAAVSGDVRRALDIGRRVIELVGQEKKVLKSIENFDSIFENHIESPISKSDGSTKQPSTVNLNQVVNVLNNVYGTAQNLTEDEDAFPLQQKLVICSVLLILKKGKNKDITIGKLHEVYRRVCTKRNIHAVDQAEFVGLCSLIETRGILKVTGKKEPRLHKISLEWDEEEVGSALKDKQLIAAILQDDSGLGKL